MSKRAIPKTSRKLFARVAEDELAKSERREIAFQKAEREERAAKLRLPVSHEPASQSMKRAAKADWSR
jgi:hypothetical protein